MDINAATLLQENGFHRFDNLWAIQGEWVEPPNHRRGGWSGVVKLELRRTEGDPVPVFVKLQENHTYRSLQTGLRLRPTLEREYENLLALSAEGFRVTEPLHFDTHRADGKIRAVLITREMEGYESLRHVVYRGVAGEDIGDLKARLVPAVARLARRLHEGGWAHGAFYPKHLFMAGAAASSAADLAMIDLETARRLGRVGLKQIVRDLGPCYRRCASILTRRDVIRFLRAYAPGAEGRPLRRRLLKAIPVDERAG